MLAAPGVVYDQKIYLTSKLGASWQLLLDGIIQAFDRLPAKVRCFGSLLSKRHKDLKHQCKNQNDLFHV